MYKITKANATEIAFKKIGQLAFASGDQFEILVNETREVNRGWVFFYNTADYVRTRNPMHALAGNGPILVLRNGQVLELPSAIPWEEALDRV